jgi:hypothetical protein
MPITDSVQSNLDNLLALAEGLQILLVFLVLVCLNF